MVPPGSFSAARLDPAGLPWLLGSVCRSLRDTRHLPVRRREASDSRDSRTRGDGTGTRQKRGHTPPDVDNRRVHDPHEHGRSRGGASYVVGGYSPNQPTPARTNESGLNNRGTTAATRLARRPLGGQRIYRLAGDAWDGPPKARHSFRSSGMWTSRSGGNSQDQATRIFLVLPLAVTSCDELLSLSGHAR